MDVHKIKRKAVAILQNRLQNGDVSVVDQRGKHNNGARNIGQELKEMMKAHVLQYPLEHVHYSRRHENDQYLPSNLTVALMFREFRHEHPNMAGLENKEWLYRSIFKDTNIRISQPKTDTCSLVMLS